MISVLISEVMQKCNLKQKELAVVLDVPLQRVKRLAGGEAKKLTPDETRRLVQTLNLSAHWLATGEEPMFNPQGGEQMGELLTQMRLCSERVARMGLEGVQAQAARDIALGVAVDDVNTVRSGLSLLALSPDEEELLALFRAAPLAVKAAAIGALHGAAAAPRAAKPRVARRTDPGGMSMNNSGPDAVQVSSGGGAVTIKKGR